MKIRLTRKMYVRAQRIADANRRVEDAQKNLAKSHEQVMLATQRLADSQIKLQEALKPILQKRKLKVIVLCTEATQAAAAAFLMSLRAAGYSEAAITRLPLSCVGYKAVVVWHPTVESAAQTVGEVQLAAPEAYQLILTYPNLQVPRGEKVLISNSELRLRGDIEQVADLPTAPAAR